MGGRTGHGESDGTMKFNGTLEQRSLLLMLSETLFIPDSHKELFWIFDGETVIVRLHVEMLGMLIAALQLGGHKVGRDFLERCAAADHWGATEKQVFEDMAFLNGVWKE